MKKVLFIINPKSGMDRVKAIQESIEKYLDKNLFSYEIKYTEYAKHGTDLAKQAIQDKVDIIAAVGGDGSVNDIVRGIYGTDTLLAVLPKGSGNGLARSVGIPLDIKKGIAIINQFNPIEIDLGMANGQLFCSNAGIGFDAVVASEFKKSKTRGFISYSWIITKFLWSYKIPEYEFDMDGHKGKAALFMMTVANAIQLGYGFKIAPFADLSDGLFDVVLIRKFPKIMAFMIAIRAFQGKIYKSRYIQHHKASKVKISGESLNIFQFDGEAQQCDGAVIIKMLPKSLKILVAK